MPSTPAERKALLFLSGVLCLGVGVRAVGAVRREPPPAEARAALARQIDAVDSARRAAREAGKGRRQRAERSGKRAAVRSGEAGRSRAAATPLHPARDTLRPAPVDLDTAGAATIERLPRIGPALARRIVTERERGGPYGSLATLERRVRGVGPALARALDGQVTFSLSPRPSGAMEQPRGGPR